MGLLNTFFVGTDLDAEAYNDRAPRDITEKFEGKGMTNIEIASLWAVMQGVGYSQQLLETFSTIRDEEEEWIFRFPSTFTERLGGFDESAFSPLAKAWMEANPAERWQLDGALYFIANLNKLAKVAKAKGANLYLWVCL